MITRYTTLLLSLTLLACTKQTKLAPDAFYTQGNTNRMAAEWEPAAGVMVAWPLAIPYKLVVELANDSQLITLIENEQAGREARRWYAQWGIDTTRVRFAVAPQSVDAWWVRDWVAEESYLDEETKKHYKTMGWRGGDALHCRTRALWDKDMLYMTAKRLPASVGKNEPLIVYTTIIDYSKKGLVANSPKLHWRVRGEAAWQETPLTEADTATHFMATIPAKAAAGTIEYYLTATSTSGRTETLPRTAPAGYYSVRRGE